MGAVQLDSSQIVGLVAGRRVELGQTNAGNAVGAVKSAPAGFCAGKFAPVSKAPPKRHW